MSRYFTLPEAAIALEIVRPMMEEVVAICRKIIADRPEIWPVIEKSAGNGGNPALSRLVDEFERLDQLLHQVQEIGAVVKDIETGLLDFPALRHDREVYLCWQVGEEEIGYWHEVEAGFAGRQPIEDF
ncbi:MAG: DUF2203 domain-containing protein [Chloroflexota bacterium]